jgi:hypothetical protein
MRQGVLPDPGAALGTRHSARERSDMLEPKEIAERLEQRAELPGGEEERFAGYAVMGVPFASCHVLGLRHFPASSLGPGYTSVWHRDPDGRWVFCQDVPPEQGCSLYFGSALEGSLTGQVRIVWPGPRELIVSVQARPLTL